MSKIEDVLSLVEKNENLKKEFAQAIKDQKVVEFFKSQGCDVTKDEIDKYIEKKKGELSDEDLDKISGGLSCTDVARIVVLSTTGVGCMAVSIAQVADSQSSCHPEDFKG